MGIWSLKDICICRCKSRGSNLEKIRCPIYGPDYVETEIEQETFDFLWSLKNYSTFNGAEDVKSPVFRGGPKSNHSWQLKVRPKKKKCWQEFVSIRLLLTAFGDGNTSEYRKINARFQISILDDEGRPGKQKGSATMDVCKFRINHSYGYDKFIRTADLVNPTRKLVEDDYLKIHCRVWIEGDLKHKICNGIAVKKSLPEKEKVTRRQEKLEVCNDLGKIFKEAVMTDIAVITPSNVFMAHKAILAARSSVFSAMFNTNMVEKKMNSVEISDFENKIVKAMLEYLYTGETELLTKRAPDLLQISEKYDLAGLKEECEYSIADNLNVKNAAQVLVLAHMYNANLLKSRVTEYINCNKEDVKKTKSFQQVAQAHANVFVDLYLSQ